MAREHNIKTPLMTMLFRDGALYFLCLLSLNVLSIVGILTHTFIWAARFLTSLSSIIITHFLLNLRQLQYGSENSSEMSCPSFVRNGEPEQARSHGSASIRFGSLIGNMGESLIHGSNIGDAEEPWEGEQVLQDGTNEDNQDGEVAEVVVTDPSPSV
ncbi:hypothetical protein CERSUDRAFT_96219 [Gelatoporia subvermispora B]|uniref:Uncharacterized protein n=1 Tax=Ceriporiopsis subvermispora (strain B) TaxID=914234 RepID=M2RB44_CERS8|nr:hypothetical protein CERSUDRAFT_96219 [Gelatoporia subvermispora B]